MNKTIDLVLSLPPTAEHLTSNMKNWAKGRGKQGTANYRHIFGDARARGLGLTIAELEQMVVELSPSEFDRILAERAEKTVISLPQFVQSMNDAGVEWGVIEYEAPESQADTAESELNNRTAKIAA